MAFGVLPEAQSPIGQLKYLQRGEFTKMYLQRGEFKMTDFQYHPLS